MPKLDDILRSSIRKYGLNTVTRGESVAEDFPRIPTGIFSLDYAIGGGFPIQVTSSLYGPPGGGKSLVLQKLIASAQNLCWQCFNYHWDCECDKSDRRDAVIVCTEIMDTEWARLLGVKVNDLVMVEPEYGEQAVDIIIEVLQAPDVGLVCLDSLAMLTPLAELQSSAEDFQVASQARLIAKMIRKIKSTLIREKKKGHNVAFVASNQIRVKIGQFFGNPEEVPGGYASKHDWHLTLRMSQLKSDDVDKETEMTINGKFKASMVAMGNKRKIFTLSGAAEFFCTVGEGGEFVKGTIADFNTVDKFGAEIGVINKSPWGVLGRTWETKRDMLEDWKMDDQFYLSVKKKIIDEYRNMAKMQMGPE